MTAQPVLELFDSSDNILEAKKGNLVAVGPKARAKTPKRGPTGDTKILGHLVWYSISDALRMTPETLSAAIAEAGMEPKWLLPRPPTLSAALSRAANAASRAHLPLHALRDGTPLDEEHFANVIFRSTGRGNKQAVTEILNAEKRRLFYEPFASVEVEEGRLVVESLLDGEAQMGHESQAIKDLREAFAFERGRHDGEAVRRVILRCLRAANAVPLRNSGGMYLINRNHPEETEEVLAFVAHVKNTASSSPAKHARTPRATTLPYADGDEYREVIADSLDDFVGNESRALIREMVALSSSGDPVTKKRAEKLVSRVKELKGSVKEYEELLETRATDARANLDVAAKKARALLALVSG